MRSVSAKIFRDRTPFIGRERERALLIDDLARGTGLLMLTGPSGIGKTRLARQVGSEIAASYLEGGGVFFCSLGGCQSAADFESAVARTLGIPQKQGDELARAIANRGPLLLILDNVDSVATKVRDVLGRWLDLCDELQMMATSIIPIGLEGEVRVEIGPMEAADAVALYLERAHRAWADRTFSPTEETVVAELVGRLDRIPLAIELAAARVRVLPPKTLLSRFGERFELLRSSSPGRQGSLVEALTLTWELLLDREKAILSRASVFDGGFTFEAAMKVLDDGGAEMETLDLLDGLRSKALLQIDDSDPPRFQLFESVQDFAHLELARSGQLEESVRRHSEFFLENGERHLAAIEGRTALESIRWLKSERENLVAVHLRNRETKPELSARAGLILAPVATLEGPLPSESNLPESTLDAARRSGNPRLTLQALQLHAGSLMQQGKIDDAISDLEEALALARRAADRKEEALVLIRTGSLHVRRGEIEAAIPLLDLALTIAREVEAPLLEGMALMARGAGELGRQAVDEAEALYNRSLEIFRRHGFIRREGIVLTWVSGVWTSQGRFREARRALRESLALSRQMESRTYEANTLTNLGAVDLAAGLLDEAESYSLQALAMEREIGNRTGEGLAIGNLGIIALERGDPTLAESRLSEAEGILIECGVRGFHAELLPYIAIVEARCGRLAEARRCLEEARSWFGSVDDRASLARAELVEGIFEVAEARSLAATNTNAAEALIERARSRLAAAEARTSGPVGALSTTLRLLRQDLELWNAGLREASLKLPSNGLKVGPDAGWFEMSGGPRVDLRRRIAIRRIFDALAERRLTSPGAGVAPHELFDVGWPGVKLDPEVAMKRVYLGIWALRDLGLTDVLLHQTDGYLLDPKLPLLRQRE